MKKLILPMAVFSIILISINAYAGQPLGASSHWLAQPHSMAFGNSLDEWIEAYVRWLEDGMDPTARVKNVAFLPIIGDGSPFEVEIEAGTALVLPVALWLGERYADPSFPDDEPFPDEWFGDPDHIWGTVQLDEGPVIDIDEHYYVGPTYLDPSALMFGSEFIFYQAIACVILPLPVGDHDVFLQAGYEDFGVMFDNTWNISVVPGKGKK